jgi:hypothetical protein
MIGSFKQGWEIKGGTRPCWGNVRAHAYRVVFAPGGVKQASTPLGFRNFAQHVFRGCLARTTSFDSGLEIALVDIGFREVSLLTTVLSQEIEE